MPSQYVRQTAVPCSILDISSGSWVQNNGLTPSGVQTDRGMISRASIIGVVIEKHSDISFSLDDGTSIINVRSFDAKPHISAAIGDVVLIIGRPREYNSERYLVLEIIKRLKNPSWIAYRKKELEFLSNVVSETDVVSLERKRAFTEQVVAAAQMAQINGSTQGTVSVEEIVQKSAAQNPFEKILSAIRSLDAGGGADVEEVIAAVNNPESEDLIRSLLEEGEIFEVRPGQVKVLE